MKSRIIAKLRKIEDEKTRKTFLINTFGLIGFITSIVFGIDGILENRDPIYNISLFSLAIIVGANFVYFFVKKDIAFSAHVIVMSFFIISLLLFAVMGVNGSGVLWYYVFSGLAILLTDTSKGVFYILLISLITVFFFLNPFDLPIIKYPTDFIIRFFASYLVVNLFLLAFEYTRSLSYSAYLKTLEEVKKRNLEISAQNDEIERKNSALKVMNATKDKFFSIIAHDLKNPFNGILGFTELLIISLQQNSKEDCMDYSSIIHSSAKNACNLLENLLEWSRSQTGGIKFNPQNIELSSLVLENVSICESLAVAKKIEIRYDLPNDNISIYADQNMLNTILRNLITNAIKFTHKGGIVTISARALDSFVEIAVSDTGIGMNEETKNKLFKINEKISIEGTEKETGTGLGLILCKEFVEKHSGRILVESQLDKGSCFKFTVPQNNKHSKT
jgi:signal transduction histidine kinase